MKWELCRPVAFDLVYFDAAEDSKDQALNIMWEEVEF